MQPIDINDLLDTVFEIVGIKDSPAASKVKANVLDNYEVSKAVCRAEEEIMQALLDVTAEEMANMTTEPQEEN